MRLMLKSILLAAGCAMASATPGLAQTVTNNISTTTPITVGNWTFQLTGCGTSGSANCATDIVVATATAVTLSLVFEGPGGSALETSAAGGYSDLSFSSITVTAPSGQQIYSVGAIVAGTPSSSATLDKNRVSVSSGTVYANGVGSASQAISTLASSPTLQSITFAPSNSVYSLTDFGTRASTSGPATMTSATLIYNAPEPVSGSILAAGLAGLGWIKRKARRPV